MTAPLRTMPDRYDVYRVVTDLEALHEAFRDRVEDMDVSRIEIDEASGLTPGYAAKLLSDPPMRFLGLKTLPKILKGTRLKIALIEDNGAPMPELPKRKYKIGRLLSVDPAPLSIPLSIPVEIQKTPDLERKQRMQELGRKGGKQRLKTMSKRARQRVATHAARKRWAKRRA